MFLLRLRALLPILPHLVKNMLSVLQGLLGQISLPLDLDVQTGGDIRDQDVDKFADTEHDVLEDDHKGELESENLPMNRSEHTILVSKASVVAFRLESYFTITIQSSKDRSVARCKVYSPWRTLIIAK